MYTSTKTIRMIKSRRMRWTGHVAYMRRGRNKYTILAEKPETKRLVGRPRSK
jgi:hypothetical protein